MTRTGKIARLPRAIREQLNRRLQDGEPGTRLVAWLNTLPEVQTMLADEFGGRPVSEQNLSEWKQGGYRDWLAKQELLEQTRELAADAAELAEVANGSLADHLAVALSGRYAAALAGWNGEWNDEFRRKLRGLRGLCQDIVELRRGDHSAARLKLERERLHEKNEEEIIEYFKRWAQTPQMREWICGNCLDEQERQRRLREIFGLDPLNTRGPANGHQAQSNLIKSNQTE